MSKADLVFVNSKNALKTQKPTSKPKPKSTPKKKK